MQSRFEQVIARKVEEAKTAMVRLTLGDALGHARLKGVIEGLSEASALYRTEVVGTTGDQEDEV